MLTAAVLAVLCLAVLAVVQAGNLLVNLRARRLDLLHDREDRERFLRHEAEAARAELTQVQVLSEVRQMRETASRALVDARQAVLQELAEHFTRRVLDVHADSDAGPDHPVLPGLREAAEHVRRRLQDAAAPAVLDVELPAAAGSQPPAVISGAWLRRLGDKAQMLVELNGHWRLLASANLGDQFSHIAEPNGMRRAPVDEDALAGGGGGH